MPSRSRRIRRRFPNRTRRDAEEFAREHGFRHEYIETHEFDNPDYVKNDRDRCFHCKDELFTRLDEVARERGIAHVIYGVNVDDLGDYRPGQRAAKLHQVKAPLVDAGLTKAEIRELSQRAGLDHLGPSGVGVPEFADSVRNAGDDQNVKTVDRGEDAIRALGFRQFRVRFHGDMVRIEIAPEELERAMTLEMARAVHGDFQEARVPLRDAGSGRVPAGVAERGA